MAILNEIDPFWHQKFWGITTDQNTFHRLPMEPPVPIGSMYSIFTYTQVTNGRSSQIYQSHQLSGLFFDPTCFITPHGGKQSSQRIHSTFAEATRSHWPHDIWQRSSLDLLRRKRRGAKVGSVLVLDWLVVEPTHLKNMLVKLGIFPQFSGWKWNIFELPQSSWGFLKVELYFHPWSFTFAEDTKSNYLNFRSFLLKSQKISDSKNTTLEDEPK